MVSWIFEQTKQCWISEPCFIICTTGNSSIIRKNTIVNKLTMPANDITVLGNETEVEFDFLCGNILRKTVSNAIPEETCGEECAKQIFKNETGILIEKNSEGIYQLINNERVIATATDARLYRGENFQALNLWFKTDEDLHKIAVSALWNNLERKEMSKRMSSTGDGKNYKESWGGGYLEILNHKRSDLLNCFRKRNQKKNIEILEKGIATSVSI